jgi:Co/Zn/Cd efflux system component
MKKSVFNIPKMDCSSEEQLIRLKLQNVIQVKQLQFDIPSRKLEVIHSDEVQEISELIDSLKLGSKLITSDETSEIILKADERLERKILFWVFGINFSFFVIEIVAGLIAGSMSLIADSLDMLADALVFGMSLFVVGASLYRKKFVAKASGYLQLILALGGIIEVVRRALDFDQTPDYKTMIIIASFTLIGNAASLILLQKAKSKHDVHMKAGRIFLANDVLISFGVILAGVLVLLLSSRLPDLIVGSVVFLIVARGAFRILKLSK